MISSVTPSLTASVTSHSTTRPVATAASAAGSFGHFDKAGDFILHLRPYYQDTDAGGVVYHTRYLEFAERARNELLRHFALPTTYLAEQDSVLFALRSLVAEWRKPATLESLLTIKTRPLALSGARLTFAQEFFAPEAENPSEPRVILHPTLVCMHKDTGKAARIPASLTKALRQHWQDLPRHTSPSPNQANP